MVSVFVFIHILFKTVYTNEMHRKKSYGLTLTADMLTDINDRNFKTKTKNEEFCYTVPGVLMMCTTIVIIIVNCLYLVLELKLIKANI